MHPARHRGSHTRTDSAQTHHTTSIATNSAPYTRLITTSALDEATLHVSAGYDYDIHVVGIDDYPYEYYPYANYPYALQSEYSGDVFGTADYASSYASYGAFYDGVLADYDLINDPQRRFKDLLHSTDDQWIRSMRQVRVT